MSDIIEKAFNELPNFSDKDLIRFNELSFDIYHLMRIIDHCEFWLEEGNWNEYNENKKHREYRLSKYKEDLKNLEYKRDLIKQKYEIGRDKDR